MQQMGSHLYKPSRFPWRETPHPSLETYSHVRTRRAYGNCQYPLAEGFSYKIFVVFVT